ncbi:DUF895 domain protein [Cordyceps fumosorosea ARSEF 2679]|uniref:DUF895 domain protein n=1 Tax=Cordyceps fumosorosea (strain ARSEF 2679) TaxID=1081104 RepID=A0A168D5N8_CORFA|nr:DUF895 domain protein [Cordyceps fumosorosea ARSEF 2679]OAA72200.1 DUF895 domain protein [Cordyceps fumosorosea ARSEF 2679]
MHSAISNLGAGGMHDVQLSDIANSVLYGCFFPGGFFAGSVNTNRFPCRVEHPWTAPDPLDRDHRIRPLTRRPLELPSLILAGAILGLSASLFWAAQGAVMMSYPTKRDKGRSYNLFWSLFQLGTLVRHRRLHRHHHHSADVCRIQLCCRTASSAATAQRSRSRHLWDRGRGAVEFGAITSFLFNDRTRALVALLTGLGSIIGSVIIGLLKDTLPFPRRNSSLVASAAVFLMVCAVWGGGVAFRSTFSVAILCYGGSLFHGTGWTVLLEDPMFAYYVVDAAFNGLAHYTMSAITNEPFRLARTAAYYKAIRSAGAAVSFGMDAVDTPYLGEILISWLLIVIALPLSRTYDDDDDVENAGLTKVVSPKSAAAAQRAEEN